MSTLPSGYAVCLRKMALAGVDWIERHGIEGLAFTLPPDEGALVFIAPLSAAVISMLAPNETSRAFLSALDAATGSEGTALQACQIIRAMYLPVTDWTDDFWHGLLARGSELVRERGGKPS